MWGSSAAMHLSPHWGPVNLISMCVCLYIRSSVSPSICLSLSLSGRPLRCLEIIYADRNCAQGMWPQAMGSNPLSGSIIYLSVCPSVRLVVRGPFAVFVFVLISSVGVQRRDEFI